MRCLTEVFMIRELISESGLLPAIPTGAAKAFDARKGLLVERVNQALAARNDLERLIGKMDAVEMMHDNHRNHAMFLTTVLHLSAFRLLASVIPWVYRTYRNYGFSFDYFPVALNAWKAAMKIELSELDAAAVFPVYDWMIERHDRFVCVAENITGDEPLAESNENAHKFYQAIVRKDINEALKIGENELARDLRPDRFYQHTLKPAMYQVGFHWQQGKLSVAEEHIATSVAQTVVSTLHLKNPGTGRAVGKAMIAAVAGELHDLGARIISHSLAFSGWEVTCLGANLPVMTIIEAARKIRPNFAGFSLTMPYHLQYLRKIIDIFKADPVLCGVSIMAGGSVFCLFPEARGYFTDIAIINDIAAAVQKAGEWQNA